MVPRCDSGDKDTQKRTSMINTTIYAMLKKILLYTLFAFLVLGTIYLSISLAIRMNADGIQREEIVSAEELFVDVEKAVISNRVNRLISDVLYVADSLRLGNIGAGDYSEIEKQWMAFSDRKKFYDQIRYIDLDGNEVIRINYSEEGSYAISKQDLQNKKDRHYFIDSIHLNQNQIYLSKLDLNIEHDEVEQPIKPMIRLSTPFYAEDGTLKGIVILNYSALDILTQVKKIAATSRGHIFMLNSDSYWLLNEEDSSKEWAFMYEDRAGENFSTAFPEEWKTITEQREGTLITSNGLFSFSTILTSKEFSGDNAVNSIVLDEGDWYLVSYLGPTNQNGLLFFENMPDKIVYIIKTNFSMFLLLFVVSVVIAALVTFNKIKKDKIKYFSEYDTMTGVYNRRAGFERLNKIYKNASKDSGKISICFIDINGLKDVNDHLGHETGDDLILSIVDGIKANIRDTDFVCRLGGDEFLIVFHNMDAAGAENVWTRINDGYGKTNETAGKNYIISASHGIEEFKFSPNEYVDAVVNRADEEMYQEKRLLKQNLNVVTA